MISGEHTGRASVSELEALRVKLAEETSRRKLIEAELALSEARLSELEKIDPTTTPALEETAHAVDDFFQQVMDTMGQGLTITDRNGKLVFANRRFLSMLGYELEELRGKTPFAWTFEEDFARLSGTFKKRIAGVTSSYETRLRSAKGESIQVMLTGAPVMKDGVYTGSITVVTDLNVRLEMERQLRTEKDRAEALAAQLEEEARFANDHASESERVSRVRTQFLANMSHELRTPMNGVLGMTELLLSEELNPEQRKRAEIIRSSGQSLLTIINDILDLAKLDAGKVEFEYLNISLRDLLEEFSQTHALQARQKQLTFVCEIHPAVPDRIVADPVRIRQILDNLTSNALKFTRNGGIEIRVRVVRLLPAGHIRLRFSVSDTGDGIREEAIPKLFDAFTQAEASTTRLYGGTGLGLAICKQLAEKMSGEIGVYSEHGSGSRFWFEIEVPLVESEAPVTDAASAGILQSLDEPAKIGPGEFDPIRSEAPPIATRPPEASGGRVLLAEDNAINQLVATGLLKRLGCDVVVAQNGVEAIEHLRREHFDLVLMDVQMPEMDGYESTRAIRAGDAGEAARKVPIVAMTAHASESVRQSCIGAGMTDYLRKPVEPKSLTEAIRRHLDPVTKRPAPASPPNSPKSGDEALATNNIPLLDLPQLRENLDDDEVVMVEVMRAAQVGLQNLLERLHGAVRGSDADATRGILHDIRGIALTGCLSRLVSSVDALHDAVKRDPETIASAVECVDQVFTATMDKISALIAERAAVDGAV